MGRTKYKAREELLNFPVRTRVTEVTYKRLEKLVAESNCQSVGEVARKILSREKILCFYKDITMNAPMEELASIRKELKSIGININQLTKGYNSAKEEAHRAFYILKVLEQYKPVEAKVDRLLLLVSALAEKWLQK
ncbi:mobilization protein [uncultured Mucilaginibacter sp.]|uniref:mobilization protein n=1 Tax=uncultured Mucilaginibacter sp. TaxID=797541 RepID=UPI0026344789|nr:mobilization protein [uncultured Mucilaginibacter sp.]